MEVKVLMGAQGVPHKRAMAPTGPPISSQEAQMAKNDFTKKEKIEKNEQNHELRFVFFFFFMIPQISDRQGRS